METGLASTRLMERSSHPQTRSTLACENYANKKKKEGKKERKKPQCLILFVFKVHAVQSQILNKCKTQVSKLGTKTNRP